MNRRSVAVLFLISLVAFMNAAQPAYAVLGNSWTEKTPMPNPEGELNAVSVNGMIYAIGTNYTSGSAFNYMYNPSTDNWTTKTPLPNAQGGYAIAVSQGKIYAFNINTTFMYDPTTDNWTAKAPTPMPRELAQTQANAVNDKIYIIGGISPNGSTILDVNEAYDPSNNSWTELAPAPNPVFEYTSTVFDGKIYVIGGGTYGSFLTSIQIYDPSTDSWSVDNSLPFLGNAFPQGTAAVSTTGTFAPARIYLVGTGVTEIYDPIEHNWTNGATMPTPRDSPKVAVVNDSLYVIGGIVYRTPMLGIFSTANEVYTPLEYESNSSSPAPSASLSSPPTASTSVFPTPSPSIPEFPTRIILLLALLGTVSATILRKREKKV